MTNFEKIKHMSVEEMAEFICDASNTDACDRCEYCEICDDIDPNIDNACEIGVKLWLESEAE